MREIDNNINNSNVNFQNIQKPIQEEVVAEAAPTQPKETREINDLSGMPAASLGKTQVSSDNIEGDMKFLEKNPALAKAITQAIDKYAESHTEDETLQMIEKAHQEFVAKK